ncbi:MAK10-like protein [Tanacetum coccineum]
MEAHLAPMQPTQVNKITTLCEICSGLYDTQYCMKDPEQVFVEYASSRADEGDARLSKFEADFKQQQSEMTNKIDTVLKAITDRIAGALPSDTVKNPKLSTSPLFKNLNIGLLEETDHIFGLADGTKSYPVGIVEDVEVHIGKLKLLDDFYVIDKKKDPETPLLVGRGFLATANAVIDCRMARDGSFSYATSLYHGIYDCQSTLGTRKDKRRGVEYVMSKILVFYKECLELGPEYATGMDDKGEVTFLHLGWHLEENTGELGHLEKKNRHDYGNLQPNIMKNYSTECGDGFEIKGRHRVKDKILATSSETPTIENAPAEMLRNMEQQMEKRADDGKANVVTGTLSRKERVKPRRVRAMAMTIQYGVRGMILAAQSEVFKQENVPLVGSEMDEAHASRYLVHPGADKKYYNLGDMYWWP